jgi:hypothetical protein
MRELLRWKRYERHLFLHLEKVHRKKYATFVNMMFFCKNIKYIWSHTRVKEQCTVGVATVHRQGCEILGCRWFGRPDFLQWRSDARYFDHNYGTCLPPTRKNVYQFIRTKQKVSVRR